MTWLEWTAAIADALAWPVAAVVIVFLVRKHLLGLIPRLRSLAFRAFRADFGEALDEAERTAAALPGPGEVTWAERAPFTSALAGATAGIALVMDPGSAVDEAWRDLRQDLLAALRQEGYQGRLNREAIREHLVGTDRLPESAADVLDTLEELRLKTVEEPAALDPKSAQRFKILSDRLRRELRNPGLESDRVSEGAAE